MYNIAILLTCYNRREKTVSCISSIYEAKDNYNDGLNISIYLTDDGSTDGTSLLIQTLFPKVNILQGNGSLFWAGGMRNSWNEALRAGVYDGFLLINDDTYVFKNLFADLIAANSFSLEKFNKEGIYVGSTCDPDSGEFSYGGSVMMNKFFFTSKYLIPNKQYQPCHFANGNILYISAVVVKKIGVIPSGYVHGVADYDYSYYAFLRKFPVFVLKEFNGYCERDKHVENYTVFKNLSFRKRIEYLYSPLGLQFKEQLLFQKRFFIWRYPIVFFIGWFKIFFPNLYVALSNIRKVN